MSEDVQQEVSTEVVSPSPEVSQEVVAPSPESPSQPPGEGQEKVVPETQSQAPVYTPNYKFKVTTADEQKQEKEFDEFIRGVIKDQETEKKVRELYEKANGLDFYKANSENKLKKLSEFETQYKTLDSQVSEILDYKDKGDLDTFFKSVNLSEEAVAKWMLEKINRLNLPPEQQQIYNQYEETRRRNQILEKQFQELNGTSQAQAVQARTLELESGLQRPEVSSFAQSFDAAARRPGAFKDAVRERGIYEWKVNNKDLSAQEAIQAVMSQFQGFVSPQAAAQQNNSENVIKEPLPVIPQVKGRSISPTGKQVRSIADLKKRAADISG